MPEERPATGEFVVVVNGEEQWSIWPAHRPVPAGWAEEGTVGTRAACLDHIEECWTDIRPRGVREAAGADS